MKRAFISVAVILFVIGAVYIWGHRRDYALLSNLLPSRNADGLEISPARPLDWREVDETSQGFKLEMPGEPKRVIAQATNEAGTTDPISMLLVNADTDRTFAVAWADRPAVARMNDLIPDKTLDQARDGAMSRTATTLVTESRNNPQGYPGRDVVSHNAGGGVLDTRFVYAGSRLYMLIAVAPSAAARNQQEVTHFFNSFAVDSNTTLPEKLPPASQ